MVALGIGTGVDMNELNSMASSPQNKNVILVRDFSRLSDVEEQLRDVSCPGQYLSLISLVYVASEDRFPQFFHCDIPHEIFSRSVVESSTSH